MCSFFKDQFDIKINKEYCCRILKSGPTKEIGRPTIFIPEAEQVLLDAVLFNDSCGFPMSAEHIRQLAFDMATPETCARFGADGPTKHWFRNWFERMIEVNPDLVHVETRGRESATRILEKHL